jgi:23S rRNA pseudouridine1911/1915/1917 synthase
VTRAISVTADERLGGRRLDELLQAWLPEALGRPLSRGDVRRIVIAGAVRVNGKPTRGPAQIVSRGARVEARVRLDRLRAPRVQAAYTLTARDVVLEDDALIVVSKPPGLPTHATADPRRDNLVAALQRYLGPPRAYLGVHQRLDRDTSGLVVFSRTKAAAPALARQFESREVVKRYRALTARAELLPPQHWRATGRLVARRGGHEPGMRVVDLGGVDAETEFSRLEVLAAALLVEARPLTGRKHQIRAHLADAGLPVLGDALYGGPLRVQRLEVPRLMLHAAVLELRHPNTGRELVLESPLPPDFVAMLEALREPPRRS